MGDIKIDLGQILCEMQIGLNWLSTGSSGGFLSTIIKYLMS